MTPQLTLVCSIQIGALCLTPLAVRTLHAQAPAAASAYVVNEIQSPTRTASPPMPPAKAR